MAVDYDLIYKIGMLILGAITSGKLVIELLRGQQSRIREEYKFARDFFLDLKTDPHLHPFLRQKGLQAIAGDTRLSESEIEYLLSLQDSARRLKDYVFARTYLEHFATAGSVQIKFKRKYLALWSRFWRKAFYFLLYFACYILAFLPFFLPTFKLLEPVRTSATIGVAALFFLPAAFFSLKEGVRIIRAEALVEKQQRHASSSF